MGDLRNHLRFEQDETADYNRRGCQEQFIKSFEFSSQDATALCSGGLQRLGYFSGTQQRDDDAVGFRDKSLFPGQ